MEIASRSNGWMTSLQQILWHGAISLLAVVIAFALPSVARYILYDWWPRVEADSNLLLVTEIICASVLVLLFNYLKIAWDHRSKVVNARAAALVYARYPGHNWFTRLRERHLVRQLPPSRDAFIFSLTGFDTFIARESMTREALQTAYEIRVMLLNPQGAAVRKRVESLPGEITLLTFYREMEASITFLRELRNAGKQVSLKFYDQDPFWKIAGVGDHVWVQHVHIGYEMKEQPEYVFALQPSDPRHGLFVPFYTYFLRYWTMADHPEYDFESNELIYRDDAGNELRRTSLGLPVDGHA
ncbi:MAG TPA: hypothetical protein VF928_16765 [Usitatibacteraceae bacterium]